MVNIATCITFATYSNVSCTVTRPKQQEISIVFFSAELVLDVAAVISLISNLFINSFLTL